jgi:hypothetical protein
MTVDVLSNGDQFDSEASIFGSPQLIVHQFFRLREA